MQESQVTSKTQDLWYTHFWFVLETILKNEPKNDISNVKTAIMNVCSFIPCEKCRTHFQAFISKVPMKDPVEWMNNYKQSIYSEKLLSENKSKNVPKSCCKKT